MTAVPFDSLKMVRKLEAADFPVPQAAGAAEALAEAMVGGERATMDDRLAVKADPFAVKTDIENKLERLEGKLKILRRNMTIRLGAILIGSTSIVLAAIRFMALHP
jgi:hypothetical protein